MGLSIEEVKKALKQCKLAGPCGDCPLKEDDECVRIMKAEAIKAIEDLEKRNEPMLMTTIGETADGIEVGICPVCNKSLANDLRRPTKYCKFCGQAVKWE